MTQYRLIYDAAAAGFHTWTFSLFGLAPVAIGLAGVLALRNDPNERYRRFARTGAPIAMIFGLLWTIGVFTTVEREYRGLSTALSDHSYLPVEGVVSDYTPEGASGRPSESWSVSGHRYVVSRYTMTSAFSTPGIVKAGERVRIADVDGMIARLEIAR